MATFIRVRNSKAINLERVVYYEVKEDSIVFYLSLDEGDTLTYSGSDLEALKWYLGRNSINVSELHKAAAVTRD